jgi:membrane-bound lytic murein transglycosylase A
MTLSPLFRPVEFAALPGWVDDDPSQAFAAFRRSAFHVLNKPYKTGSLGVAFEAFTPAYEGARAIEALDAGAARAFFEKHFAPARVEAEPAGFVSGFYEPEVEASSAHSETFPVPMYGRPPDLIDVDDTNRPEGMDPYLAFARQTPQGLVEYYARPVIDGGILQGLGLELAWLRNKVDLFFIQVQGAARLHMTDGSLKRVSYAAKSGQRFTAIGRELVAMGELRLEDVTMQSIRAWLAANPGRVDELLHRNRSYVFFRETELGDPTLGPVAAAKVQLTPGRSIAVDRLLHTFGTPFYIDASALTAFGDEPFRRLMIAQDTGSAIIGPARGDLFAGTGDAAGEIAGVVRSNADFYALVPRGLL